jgi:hypothetical protein
LHPRKVEKIPKKENIEEEDINKKDINKKDINKKDINKEDINKKDINKEDINKKDINKKDIEEKNTNETKVNKRRKLQSINTPNIEKKSVISPHEKVIVYQFIEKPNTAYLIENSHREQIYEALNNIAPSFHQYIPQLLPYIRRFADISSFEVRLPLQCDREFTVRFLSTDLGQFSQYLGTLYQILDELVSRYPFLSDPSYDIYSILHDLYFSINAISRSLYFIEEYPIKQALGVSASRTEKYIQNFQYLLEISTYISSDLSSFVLSFPIDFEKYIKSQ